MTNLPYYRIIRPHYNDYFGYEYIINSDYCPERLSLVHSYHILQNDLKKIFDYVDPHDKNLNTFSHRMYELILRACTEFEANCKGILKANGYGKTHLNIKDYFKINIASKLSEYEIKINVWSPKPLIIKPFEDWKNATYNELSWYQKYNEVKHNRSADFEKANFTTLIYSMAGLYALLSSQFFDQVFQQYQNNIMTAPSSDGFRSTENSLFAVKYPKTFPVSENYEMWNSNGKSLKRSYRQYEF